MTASRGDEASGPWRPDATPACTRDVIMPYHNRTMPADAARKGVIARNLLIGIVSFLTVVDLFGTQSILPALYRAYGVTPAAMGFAVNASTIGMAAAGLGVA